MEGSNGIDVMVLRWVCFFSRLHFTVTFPFLSYYLPLILISTILTITHTQDWTFNTQGLMEKRQMSGNDVPISDEQRWFKDLNVHVDDVVIPEEELI